MNDIMNSLVGILTSIPRDVGIVAVVVGVMMGLTGAGSGILTVPLIVLFLHWSVPQAVPVALLAVAASAVLGTLLDVRAVNLRIALLLGLIGTCTAPFGETVAHHIPNNLVNFVFAFLLLVVFYRTVTAVKPEAYSLAPVDDSPDFRAKAGRVQWSLKRAALMVVTGSIAGLLSGVLGVGGAFVIGPVLRRESELSKEAIAATTLAVVAIIASAAAVMCTSSGQMDLSIATPFCAFAIGGMIVGRFMFRFMGGYRFQKYLGFLFFLTAGAMVARNFM